MKKLLTLWTLFSIGTMLCGCAEKEITVVKTPCAKPHIDMSQFPPPEQVNFQVHKGSMVVTIKKSDYAKMKATNQSIKDKYIILRAWVFTNMENDLIKRQHL